MPNGSAGPLDQLAELKRWRRAPERPARTSTTDREARVMKLADGGCRPAYNGRVATDTASQIIVGVVPTNGHERDQRGAMVDQLEARYGRAPAEYLVNGGYVTHTEIERLGAVAMTIYLSVQPARRAGHDPHQSHPGDRPGVIAWRARMATEQARRIYRERAASAECVNVLAHNLLRAVSLRAIAAPGS